MPKSSSSTTETAASSLAPPSDHHIDESGKVFRTDVQKKMLADIEKSIVLKKGSSRERRRGAPPLYLEHADRLHQKSVELDERTQTKQKKLAERRAAAANRTKPVAPTMPPPSAIRRPATSDAKNVAGGRPTVPPPARAATPVTRPTPPPRAARPTPASAPAPPPASTAVTRKVEAFVPPAAKPTPATSQKVTPPASPASKKKK